MINAERSYWERALYEQEYDLIVVGAGLTGQSVAHFFKYYFFHICFFKSILNYFCKLFEKVFSNIF